MKRAVLLPLLLLAMPGPAAAQIGTSVYSTMLHRERAFELRTSARLNGNALTPSSIAALALVARDAQPADLFLIGRLAPAGEGIHVGSDAGTRALITWPSGSYVFGFSASAGVNGSAHVPSALVAVLRDGVQDSVADVQLGGLKARSSVQPQLGAHVMWRGARMVLAGGIEVGKSYDIINVTAVPNATSSTASVRLSADGLKSTAMLSRTRTTTRVLTPNAFVQIDIAPNVTVSTTALGLNELELATELHVGSYSVRAAGASLHGVTALQSALRKQIGSVLAVKGGALFTSYGVGLLAGVQLHGRRLRLDVDAQGDGGLRLEHARNLDVETALAIVL